MSRYWALLDIDNVVEQVIVADEEFILEHYPSAKETFLDNPEIPYVGKGAIFDPLTNTFIISET